MDANGSNIIRLTRNSADDMFPVWSPGGSRIAFVSNRDEKTELADLEGNTEIYIMNSDGSDQVNISNSPARELHPNWSPDGSRIIFNTTRDDTLRNALDHPFASFEIYSMNVDGSDWRRITNNSLTDTYASWSPDGSKILFRRKIDNNQNSEIFVMNSDGSVPVNVTNHPAFDGWPTWSPDGSKIAFASNRTGTFNIYVMNSDGSNLTKLTDSESPDEDARPNWSKDGSKILFNRMRYGTMDIYMMKVSDSK